MTNNKKQVFTAITTTVLCVMCGCGSNAKASSGGAMATDSVVYALQSGDSIECKITADYPTSDDSLSLLVTAYINGELGRLYLPANCGGDTATYRLYAGTPKATGDVAAYYANGTLRFLKEQATEMRQNGMEEKPQLACETAVRKTADNSWYISYRTTSYSFMSGAHGSYTDYTVNISKASGCVLTQTIDTTRIKQIQPLLRQGVIAYLHAQGETEADDASLNDMLFVDNGIIPIPAHTPYLADDGVHFMYQQYEIGPYAMGLIEFTVPYDKARPYLTSQALALIK